MAVCQHGVQGMSRPRLTPGLALGLVVGLAGAILTLSPAGPGLEEGFGLDGLFLVRGPRPAPPEVVIVAMDKASAARFGLPNDPRRWPRGLHARLTDNLALAGASVVGFDIHFAEPRDPVQDRQFSRALAHAGNVVLFEYLKKETLPLADTGGRPAGDAVSEQRMLPTPLLAQAAAATAPFPLPKVPVRVSQFWLHKAGAGDPATLPVVMFQLHVLKTYPELRRVLQTASPSAAALPEDAGAELRAGRLLPLMGQLRSLLQQPRVYEQVRASLADRAVAPDVRQLLLALIRVYHDGDSRYLNYYGPPRSIVTLPYHAAWQTRLPDMRGKLVLVGFSERLQPEQRDGFYTVYSQEASGLDISGVEIAATALANMLEDNPVRPLSRAGQAGLVAGWGLLIGLIVMYWRVRPGAGLLALAAMGLLAVAYGLFVLHALWLPLIVPLAVQAPAALMAGVLWHYRDVRRERNRIRQAFRHYLPERAVAALARDLEATPGGELMHGVCLSTDAARYTSLAEHMPPDELADLMNRYYELLFRPVRAHDGFVSDVVGDAMLAVWAQVQPDAVQRAQACRAALDIIQTSEQFSRSINSAGFVTRIGLHAGTILLGNIGSAEHLEYRAVGDIVNTSSRLQALNKVLGTRVLASRETTEGLEGFVMRDLGAFRLPGKTRPTTVVELCGPEVIGVDESALLHSFAAALGEFNRGEFDRARTLFVQLLEQFRQDGPTQYYLGLCEHYLARPPGPEWDGVVTVTEHRASRR